MIEFARAYDPLSQLFGLIAFQFGRAKCKMDVDERLDRVKYDVRLDDVCGRDRAMCESRVKRGVNERLGDLLESFRNQAGQI